MLKNKPIAIQRNGKDIAHTEIFLIEKGGVMNGLGLSKWEEADVKACHKNGTFISLYRYEKGSKIVVQIDKLSSKEEFKSKEEVRRLAVNILGILKRYHTAAIALRTNLSKPNLLISLAEGIVLANYQFLTYKSDKKSTPLKSISINHDLVTPKEIAEMNEILIAAYFARTFVNEPVITLTAERFSKEMEKVGKLANFKVKVLNKKDIIKEKMGGLIAVNSGSQDPPTFTIMEYKPTNAKNKKPYVLVGKGVVFDTGGLSLKPTPASMDCMKSDMAGAAAVVGAMYAIAKNKLPLHVIALVPATDNRPGENAVTPGDVITFANGKTAEILNTDAEGRLILADALHYASKYKPELVLDFATLTGAQVLAMGIYGAAIMGNASEEVKKSLVQAGNNTYERVHEMPFWEEYGELVKSDIADIKNTAGREGGCITAGKFLEHFVTYPWLHVDIAGPSFLNSNDFYRLKGGSGYGVRLIYEFLKSKI